MKDPVLTVSGDDESGSDWDLCCGAGSHRNHCERGSFGRGVAEGGDVVELIDAIIVVGTNWWNGFDASKNTGHGEIGISSQVLCGHSSGWRSRRNAEGQSGCPPGRSARQCGGAAGNREPPKVYCRRRRSAVERYLGFDCRNRGQLSRRDLSGVCN
jgi:hypothetical protein